MNLLKVDLAVRIINYKSSIFVTIKETYYLSTIYVVQD